jgi:hypothetical protein
MNEKEQKRLGEFVDALNTSGPESPDVKRLRARAGGELGELMDAAMRMRTLLAKHRFTMST